LEAAAGFPFVFAALLRLALAGGWLALQRAAQGAITNRRDAMFRRPGPDSQAELEHIVDVAKKT
jgi:hypothetical protein